VSGEEFCACDFNATAVCFFVPKKGRAHSGNDSYRSMIRLAWPWSALSTGAGNGFSGKFDDDGSTSLCAVSRECGVCKGRLHARSILRVSKAHADSGRGGRGVKVLSGL
jgi:hypothetical protein